MYQKARKQRSGSVEDGMRWVGGVGREWQETERSSWWSPEEMEERERFTGYQMSGEGSKKRCGGSRGRAEGRLSEVREQREDEAQVRDQLRRGRLISRTLRA